MTRLDQLLQQFLRERTYITNVTPKTPRLVRIGVGRRFVGRRQMRAASPLICKSDLRHFVVYLRERG